MGYRPAPDPHARPLHLRMELRQLRYFTALAEELNFTRAAERLHISQPPLSAQIAQLEAELGVKLFDRNSRKVSLTDAGAAFLRDVRVIQARLKEATQRVQDIHSGLAGRIEIGLSGSHFLGPLPQCIGELAHAYPDIDVVLNEMAPNDQLDALREQRIDISISRQHVEDDLLRSEPLWPDPLWVALPQGHALGRQAVLTLDQLATERFIMLRRDTSKFAQQIYNACLQRGFTPNVIHAVSEVPAQLSLVSAGLGVAIVPGSTRRYRAQTLSFCPLEDIGIHTQVHAVVRKAHRKSAIDTVLQQLQSFSSAS